MTTHDIRLRFNNTFLLTTAMLSLAFSPVRAQEDNKPPKGFKALFNGHDIEDWTGATEDPKKIAAMSSEERAARDAKMRTAIHEHWKVKDGLGSSRPGSAKERLQQRLRRTLEQQKT